MKDVKIGVIGGSGLYKIDGLHNERWIKVDTPFGEPSDEYMVGEISSRKIAFLPRHGRGHRILPTELNYRANIYGMKELGVEAIISICAVGSFKKEIKPLDMVIPDQFVDRTNQARKSTFFGNGIAAHITFSDPVCPVLRDVLYKVGMELGVSVHPKGTYLNIEGPAFSTRAESLLYQSWGMDIVGMTNMIEAKLAREAEICYATAAFVTDYDCWYSGEEVSIDLVIQNLEKNAEVAKSLIKRIVPVIPEERTCQCRTALKNAIITNPRLIPEAKKRELHLLIGKYIKC